MGHGASRLPVVFVRGLGGSPLAGLCNAGVVITRVNHGGNLATCSDQTTSGVRQIAFAQGRQVDGGRTAKPRFHIKHSNRTHLNNLADVDFLGSLGSRDCGLSIPLEPAFHLAACLDAIQTF